VPFGVVVHPVPDLGAMSVLWFGQPSAGLSVAYLAGAATGQFLAGNDASAYVRAWEQLRACALSPDESVALLRQLATS
jgi:hypothetical protein